MSMVINLVEDHNIYLCEGGPVYNGGVQPTPIYLTQWKLMGNSVVHTDEYLTQWKVEGNSVVDNNAILSCGDYSDVDGKYHVKISNGVDVFDIALTEPLRKVGDIADTIEFANGSAVLTRNLKEVGMATLNWIRFNTGVSYTYRYIAEVEDAYSYVATEFIKTINTGGYENVRGNDTYYHQKEQRIIGMYEVSANFTCPVFAIYDPNYNQADDLSALLTYLSDKRIIYRLATPTTETIQVSPFPISATDTYTSANDTPYSAFEYKKNVEIWSCGEYSAVDGKWHIRILPEGYGIVDIALDEPLRKVNDVADSIEYADGVGTVTRKIAATKISDNSWYAAGSASSTSRGFYTNVSSKASGYVLLCAGYNTITSGDFYWDRPNLSIGSSSVYTHRIYIKDLQYTTLEEFLQGQGNKIILYELATPTTETIQVPQIQEADSYTCVISQGGKAVEWSSFETE